ncbi:MAG: hypothetical protein LBF27_06835 [Sphingobacterium sp.]|nr:hypothetical protein [Sphingobacterium sp.]
MRYLVCLLLLLCCKLWVFGQRTQVNVEKIKESKNSGYYLKITIVKNGIKYIRNSKDYDIDMYLDKLGGQLNVADISLITEKIIPYINDYSLASTRVRKYYITSTQIDYQGMPKPKSLRYPLAIDAMFAINRLFYSLYLHRISTYPVLYDSKTLAEVNDNPTMVRLMAKRYYQWFDLVKSAKYSRIQILSSEFAQFLNKGTVKWWDMMIVSKGIRDDI